MKKRAGIILVPGLCLAAMALWLCWQPREPQAQGKPLRYWMENLRRHPERTEAASALHELGPRGIPHILRLRLERDTWLYNQYRSRWWPRLPRWIQKRLGDPSPPTFNDFVICDALTSIGPEGIPGLAQNLNNRNRNVRLSILRALQNLADQRANLAPALPALMRAMEDPSPAVRVFAAQTLGRMETAAAPAARLLIQRLSDATPEGRDFVNYGRGQVEMPEVTVQAVCAEALGRIGSEARPALAALAGFENHPNPDLRFKALVTRRQLGDAITNFVPLITRAMVECPGSQYFFMEQVRQLSLSTEEQQLIIQTLLTNRHYRLEAAGWQRKLRQNLRAKTASEE